MSTLITGGTGLIGSKIAERLLGDQEPVILYDVAPDPERVRRLDGEFGDLLAVERGDVVGLGNLGHAVRRHDVDRIIHLAYLLGAESRADPGLATQVNLVGTVNVLDVARLLDVRRVVMASSIAVYGRDSMYPKELLPLQEDVPTYVAPGSPVYGAGKVYMEHVAAFYADRHGIEVAGLRPSIVYGAGRASGGTGWVVELIEKPALGEPVKVDAGDAKMSLVYIEDVADQFVALLRAPASCFVRQRFFNSGGDTCTIRELAGIVGDIIPQASIELAESGDTDLEGLAASVTDRSLEEVVGHKRRFTPLKKGVRAHIDAVRAKAGMEPL